MHVAINYLPYLDVLHEVCADHAFLLGSHSSAGIPASRRSRLGAAIELVESGMPCLLQAPPGRRNAEAGLSSAEQVTKRTGCRVEAQLAHHAGKIKRIGGSACQNGRLV